MLIGCVSSFSKKKIGQVFFKVQLGARRLQYLLTWDFFFFFFFGVKVYQCDLKIK
jgi:hypothetical protein